MSVYKYLNNAYYIISTKWYIIWMNFLYLPFSYKLCVYVQVKV